MPFHPPSWSPPLPHVPDSISLESFIFDENYGRHPLGSSKVPFVCGITGKGYSMVETKERVDYLARALGKELGFKPNEGTEWDKVVGVFSVNALDYLSLAWATHKLGGILTPANAAYTAEELVYPLRDSGAKCLFTCLPLYQTALDACKKAGIPKERVYLLPLPEAVTQGLAAPGHKTVDDFVSEGQQLDRIEKLDWASGEAARRCAFLCYSSGTSGLPKGVMVSHYNVMANTLQLITFEAQHRATQGDHNYTESCLGILPMSHIYGLVAISHIVAYRGDRVVVLPKYDFKVLLGAIQDYKIQMLYLVPPMVIHMCKQKDVMAQYDLSCVDSLYTAAAPLGKETAEEIGRMYPKWAVRQAYGLTETSPTVCSTLPNDIWLGSSGNLITGVTARLITVEGKEITGYDQPGELWVKAPSVVLGYLNNAEATKETFVDAEDGRYMRTGDEAMISKGPNGHEHLFIVDRIKELIKVKGLQVAPAELEAVLLTHPAVDDCVVIGIPSDREGEVPKAFVVKSAQVGLEDSDAMLKREICRHVEQQKAKHKWLKGGVEFIDVVPKSPSGKILRRLMRDQEKQKTRKQGAKL